MQKFKKIQKLKEYLETNFPFVWQILVRVKRIFIYTQSDYETFWRMRAYSYSGQSRVLWGNEEYNQLVRELQENVIKRYIEKLDHGDQVLDIGCGIGVVSKMMINLNPNIQIDALDFPEMIEVAKKENPHPQINYIAGRAEEYYHPKKKYKFILSSGCFSAIKDVHKMEKAIDNCIRMLAPGGVILMIDPFHRWNYLARVKYTSRQVINFMRKRGCVLVEYSGMLFWPYRDLLANSNIHGEKLRKLFFQGERLLELLGKRFWSDYKVLAFKKIHEYE